MVVVENGLSAASTKQQEAQQESAAHLVGDAGVSNAHDTPPPPYDHKPTGGSKPFPSTVKPSNYVLVHQRSSVDGIYGIDASLQIPDNLLPPIDPDAPEELRQNLHVASKNGSVDVEVYILPDAKPCDGRKKVVLETRSSNGAHRGETSNPPFALTSFSQNGSVHVRIPRSFRGTLYLSTLHGHVKLSEEVSAQASLLRDSDGTARYLIGPFENAEAGDEVHAESKNGSVRVMYDDETVESVLKGLSSVGSAGRQATLPRPSLPTRSSTMGDDKEKQNSSKKLPQDQEATTFLITSLQQAEILYHLSPHLTRIQPRRHLPENLDHLRQRPRQPRQVLSPRNSSRNPFYFAISSHSVLPDHDCGDVVASKFFPIEGPDGKQQPLCERDYFRRLNLICAKCGMALRGSYITACNKKFHVEHFTCSICPTLFGPQDSYYEHDGDVYCHFHYSTRFATKCAGCNTAILKQFVEINRNMRDECWHPECYMINKFWNVKVVSRRPTSIDAGDHEDPPYIEEEQKETPTSLKEKQIRMEQQVYRIWTVLSAFEESSAACISDMLRQVSNGQYLDAIRMAEKFILHVEVLFATIDDLEFQFARLNMKGMSHVREARMLCRKTVELFTLLSHTQETGSRRMGMTQELLALVTGLAHYLKILIRIALTGALKLERENEAVTPSGEVVVVRDAMAAFLDKLHLLAVQQGNPGARRLIKSGKGSSAVNGAVDEESSGRTDVNWGTQGVIYGFRSLAPEYAGDSPFNPSGSGESLGNGAGDHEEGSSSRQVSPNHPPSDLCIKCNLTVEEDCCKVCGKVAAAPLPPSAKEKEKEGTSTPQEGSNTPSSAVSSSNGNQAAASSQGQPPKLTTARRPPANVSMFVYEVDSMKETSSFGVVPTVILCKEHAHSGCKGGFKSVQRLEQYAFLLNVALRRLYLLLRRQGVVPLSPETAHPAGNVSQPDSDPYRNSADIMRMKQVHLGRKLSTTARLPKRSTIVESPNRAECCAVRDEDSPPSPPRRRLLEAPTATGTSTGEITDADKPTATASVIAAAAFPTTAAQQMQQQQQGRYGPSVETSQSLQGQGQVIKPPFARNNTEVMIVDESAPNSPAIGDEGGPMGLGGVNINSSGAAVLQDGITLADLPQLMEAAQAREQQRSLPRLNSIPYIAELSALELAIVKHSAVLALARSPLKDQLDVDELLEMVEIKKGGFWKTLFKGDKKNVKKKTGTFGVPLELLVEKEGVDSLLGASRATLRVPSFIDDVISAMRQMDMSVEGIFRKNGNIRRLKELTEAIDRDPLSVDLTQDNPVQLAALLKKFLRDLPDPLLTFKLHRLMVASQSLPNEGDRKRLLHMLSVIMPKAHRDTMEVLFVFLKWVASFAHMDEETGSKMDSGNLATVICPSILYSRGRDAVRDESFGAIRVVTSLLENQDEFFAVPEEFLSILHDQEYFANSMELPAKEFMKKCDTYLRLKSGNGRPPMQMYNGPNGSAPRFPGSGPMTPNTERPPPQGMMGGPPNPNQSRPPPPPGSPSPHMSPHQHQPQHQQYPGMAHPTPTYPSNNSAAQSLATLTSPRTPQPEEWSNPPRPITANGSSSRPTSYVQPRPSMDQHPAGSYGANPNGYPQR
ncbi:Rho-type GTPase activating protein Rga1 [Paramarasmius palmivorus]|uniref:Rho-type GTPase activating protein Rga1 n=1 Tax=Paramarasmius palmivorus TaxID=297713 RepID=A0AAW0E7A2_9AGAR